MNNNNTKYIEYKEILEKIDTLPYVCYQIEKVQMNDDKNIEYKECKEYKEILEEMDNLPNKTEEKKCIRQTDTPTTFCNQPITINVKFNHEKIDFGPLSLYTPKINWDRILIPIERESLSRNVSNLILLTCIFSIVFIVIFSSNIYFMTSNYDCMRHTISLFVYLVIDTTYSLFTIVTIYRILCSSLPIVDVLQYYNCFVRPIHITWLCILIPPNIAVRSLTNYTKYGCDPYLTPYLTIPIIMKFCWLLFSLININELIIKIKDFEIRELEYLQEEEKKEKRRKEEEEEKKDIGNDNV